MPGTSGSSAWKALMARALTFTIRPELSTRSRASGSWSRIAANRAALREGRAAATSEPYLPTYLKLMHHPAW
jgi:hypothetical protein